VTKRITVDAGLFFGKVCWKTRDFLNPGDHADFYFRRYVLFSRSLNMTNYPHPPKQDTPEALGFKKEKMVAWFDPGVLSQSAVQALLADTFGKYADNREIQAASKLDDPPYTDLSDKKEIWFDYIADLGDGWDSTYTMARLLAEQQISFTDPASGKQYATQRGEFLVMGGDQVYPTASKADYNDRLIGPYRCALPWTPEGKNPLLFAIPGNHDWYDGLVSFSRLFHHKRWIGGWETRQTRSYFAIKLPHDWWVWGIDIQLGSEVDAAQVDYFRDIAQNRMRNGSRLILCSAEPSWVYAEQKGYQAYDNMAYFEKRVIEDTSGNYRHDFMVGLSGDLHTYARYEDDGGKGKQRFIAGGGGAYLYPTHDLPETLSIPQMTDSPPAVTVEKFSIGKKTNRQDNRSATAEHEKAFFPDRAASRSIADNSLLFPFKNPWFCLLAGVMYFMIAWVLDSTSRSLGAGLFETIKTEGLVNSTDVMSFSVIGWAIAWTFKMCISSPGIALLLGFIVWGLYQYAKQGITVFRRIAPPSLSEPGDGNNETVNAIDPVRSTVLQLVFALVHFSLLFVTFVFTLLLTLEIQAWNASENFFIFMACMIVIGGFFGGAVMGIYLWLGNCFLGAHSNEVYSSQSLPDYKNFLRLHIDKTGKLTIYPVGVKKVCSDWELNVKARDGAAWFEPRKGKIGEFAQLIESPITVKQKKSSSLFDWLSMK